MKLAGIWDPSLQSHNAYTWRDLSSSNKIQRNFMELKIRGVPVQLGKISNKRYQEAEKPNGHFRRTWSRNIVSGAKARY